MKKVSLFICFLIVTGICFAQKKPLDHSVYDSWRNVSSPLLQKNGNILIYYSTPQEGDTELYIKDLRSSSSETIVIPRGTGARLNEDGNKVVAVIKPFFKETRDAKIKKVKKDLMPKDTLAIIDIASGEIKKYPNLIAHKLPEKFTDFVAFELAPDKKKAEEKKISEKVENKEEQKAETKTDKKESKKDTKKIDESKIKKLLVLDLTDYTIDTIKHFSSYNFNEDGSILAYTTKPIEGDSITPTALHYYSPLSRSGFEILSGPKGSKINLPRFSDDKSLMAFYANTDTTKEGKKNINIYQFNNITNKLDIAVSNKTLGIPEGWILSENGSLYYSKDSKRLFFAIAPKPLEKDTTLVEFEQPKLDIWSWNDEYNQPMQLLNKTRDLRRSYTSYILADLSSKSLVQLGDLNVPYVSVPNEGKADYTLISDNKKYRLQSQWDITPYVDMYIVKVSDGSRKLLKERVAIGPRAVSPSGRYYVIYDMIEKGWFLVDLIEGSMKNVTKDLGVAFHNEDHDTPSIPGAYGSANWFEDDKTFIIPDRFDYWKFDATGKSEPTLLTNGYGRENNTKLRIDLIVYKEERPEFFRLNDPLYFTTFNKTTKESGLITVTNHTRKTPKLTKLVEGPYSYSNFEISFDSKKRKPIFAYRKGNFEDGSNLWLTYDNFKNQKQITDVNPQQKEYNWGTVELVNWQTEDDIFCEGLLFKPEDFDPTKKYPVMIYFYEKNSDGLYSSRVPAPSRSIINIPFFASNGYIVFVPDIYYKDGYPGESAMRSIMPGVEMLEKFPWVDSKNMAIQGQSWGGYQVAYMITKTDKFKAAGSGAPVANMTSAYGGIRWGSGMVRQFQYEQTQSRIGGTLWEKPDLYIENSPLFYLPNVTTPVLIMHNDKDGAVPWYQGIELFTGLRRLGKVAWLLQYNDEDHNLVQRRNAKDLSIRLSQFFDHYLKGAPMPEWMKYGLPATKKGYDLGYELTE